MSHISIDDVMGWLVGRVTGLTTAFVQATIQTGLSLDRSLIMLVHRIEWYVGSVPGADGVIIAQLTRTTQTAVLSPDNPLVHAYYGNNTDFTTSGQMFHERPKSEIYVTPIAIAQPSLYFGVQSSVTPSPTDASIRIGYTVRSVSEKDFFKLAQALTI